MLSYDETPAEVLKKLLEDITNIELKPTANKSPSNKSLTELTCQATADDELTKNLQLISDELTKNFVDPFSNEHETTNDHEELSLTNPHYFNPIPFNSILIDMNDQDHFSFDLFRDCSIVVVYHSFDRLIRAAIVYYGHVIFKMCQFPFNSIAPISLKAYDNHFIFDSSIPAKIATKATRHQLTIMNSNLELVQARRLPCLVVSIDANKTNIFCFMKNHNICIFDYKLNTIQVLETSNPPRSRFYLEDNSIPRFVQLGYQNNHFYCLYDNRIEIINPANGIVCKYVPIKSTRFGFDEDGNVLLLSICGKKILRYNRKMSSMPQVLFQFEQRVADFRTVLQDKLQLFY